MNEEIKRKAAEIIKKHYQESFSINVAHKHAIISTKNTISVLEKENGGRSLKEKTMGLPLVIYRKLTMKILYGFKPYDKPKPAIYNQSTNVYSSGWVNKPLECLVIGEIKDAYITELKPYSDNLNSEPTELLPIGFHKTRLIRFKTAQLSLF